MTKFVTFLLALCSAAMTITPTVAAEVESRTIAIGDLDLSGPHGRATLYARVARAAVELCGEASDVDLRGGNLVRACRKQVKADFVVQLEARLARDDRGPIHLAAR